MRPKTISLVLASALFGFALWLTVRPEATGPVPLKERGGQTGTAADRSSPALAARTHTPGAIAGSALKPDTASSPSGNNGPNLGTEGVGGGVAGGGYNADGNEQNAAGEATQEARVDVSRVRSMLRDYHTLMSENPVGTNEEIMKALMGGNAKQATLGPPEGISLNGNGELVDRWNTPYFFHQLSKDVMEIRSAGPDKVMWTADDLITR